MGQVQALNCRQPGAELDTTELGSLDPLARCEVGTDPCVIFRLLAPGNEPPRLRPVRSFQVAHLVTRLVGRVWGGRSEKWRDW